MEKLDWTVFFFFGGGGFFFWRVEGGGVVLFFLQITFSTFPQQAIFFLFLGGEGGSIT